ncbi:50 kDa spicule matrix protein-like isoform X4 [Poecile atricapillus]|uniref:50 kDa spicule matrix protein-like isoform X4 n=1 Tax=Poecile atricapillus TaxID=48891 RepID=UPI0027384735|nr:50 kDa spicule matrix protein-like isoform X4 [Poecile atricapillus]
MFLIPVFPVGTHPGTPQGLPLLPPCSIPVFPEPDPPRPLRSPEEKGQGRALVFWSMTIPNWSQKAAAGAGNEAGGGSGCHSPQGTISAQQREKNRKILGGRKMLPQGTPRARPRASWRGLIHLGGFDPSLGGIDPSLGGLIPVRGGLIPVRGGLIPVWGGLIPVWGAHPGLGGLILVWGGSSWSWELHSSLGGSSQSRGAHPSLGGSSLHQGAHPGPGGLISVWGGLIPVWGAHPGLGGSSWSWGLLQRGSSLHQGVHSSLGGLVPVQGGSSQSRGARPSPGGLVPVQGGLFQSGGVHPSPGGSSWSGGAHPSSRGSSQPSRHPQEKPHGCSFSAGIGTSGARGGSSRSLLQGCPELRTPGTFPGDLN